MSNGDYSFFIPANPDLNIPRDLYFDKSIMIERKNSATELAGNFSTHRTRFEEEMATFPGKKYLLIENTNYYDILNENYRTKFSAKAYIASLHTFNHRYGLEVMFMPDTSFSAQWIYFTLVYWLKEELK